MKVDVIDLDQVEALLNQSARAHREAKPGAKLDEFHLLTQDAEGRLVIKTGLIPPGLIPAKLKKSKKKKPTTTRRPRHVKRR